MVFPGISIPSNIYKWLGAINLYRYGRKMKFQSPRELNMQYIDLDRFGLNTFTHSFSDSSQLAVSVINVLRMRTPLGGTKSQTHYLPAMPLSIIAAYLSTSDSSRQPRYAISYKWLGNHFHPAYTLMSHIYIHT